MLSPGTLIDGKYRLQNHIGDGGMATVWRAVQFPLDRAVAIKFVHPAGPRAEELTRQFLREAKALALVRHRNVVDIIDFGLTEDHQPFMVMEFLEGETMTQKLMRTPVLSLQEVEQIFAPVLLGLAAVHDAGIVHRDMKPDNIILVRDPDGTFPKLLDFGVARSVGSAASGVMSAVQTIDGLIVGTPQYMSPEQARGLSDVDIRTDIYSMGVMLYQALSGVLPFDFPHIGEFIAAIATGTPPPFSSLRPDLPEPIRRVVETAMAKDRAQRYPDARAMRLALVDAIQLAKPMTMASTYASLGPTTTRNSTLSGRHADSDLDSTEHATRFDTVMPWKQRRAWHAWAWIIVAVAALLGALAYGVRNKLALAPTPPTQTERAPAPTPPTHTERAPVIDNTGNADNPNSAAGAAKTLPATSHTVTVRLEKVPSNATVYVDGIQHAGDVLELPFEERQRTLEVRARGFHTWTQVHRCDASATYTVALEPAQTARKTARTPPRKSLRRKPASKSR
jgi:serine/threonine protein kinase